MMKVLITVCLSSVLICNVLAAATSSPSSTPATLTTKPTNLTTQSTKPTNLTTQSTKPTNLTTQSTNPTTPTTKVPTTKTSSSSQGTTVPIPVTTLSPKEECHRGNASCKECLKVGSGQCVWCDCKKNMCTLKTNVVPTNECDCPLSATKWGVCWVNYEALIIACSVVGGLLVVGLTVCICCCCCCKGNNKAKYAREDAKMERKKTDMKAKHDDRRQERKAKTDEIRRKYGLIKEDNPYQRFEEN